MFCYWCLWEDLSFTVHLYSHVNFSSVKTDVSVDFLSLGLLLDDLFVFRAFHDLWDCLWLLLLLFFGLFIGLVLGDLMVVDLLALSSELLDLLLFVVDAVFGVVLPDDLENHIWVVGSDGGPDGLVLDGDLDEVLLVLALAVVGEPVVEVLAADTPRVVDPLRVNEGHFLHLREEDGLCGGEGEEVLVNDDAFLEDLDLRVLVDEFCHDLFIGSSPICATYSVKIAGKQQKYSIAKFFQPIPTSQQSPPVSSLFTPFPTHNDLPPSQPPFSQYYSWQYMPNNMSSKNHHKLYGLSNQR